MKQFESMHNPPKVLVADDDEDSVELLRETLTGAGYQVVTARTGDEALRVARTERPDLVLLDIMMPGQDGFEVCRLLKGDPTVSFLPILVVSALSATEDRVRGFSRGADGFVNKPFEISEIEACAHNLLALKQQHDGLQDTSRHLRDLAITDAATGLFNRRYLLERLSYEFLRARRYLTQLAIALIDIDRFKEVNDHYGHLFGDFVLQQLGRVIKRAVRETDIVARYGGEEFVILMPAIEVRGHEAATAGNEMRWSVDVAERIRSAVASHEFRDAKYCTSLTVSVGIATYPFNPADDAVELLQLADEALYEAKNAGRNRVTLWSTENGPS